MDAGPRPEGGPALLRLVTLILPGSRGVSRKTTVSLEPGAAGAVPGAGFRGGKAPDGPRRPGTTARRFRAGSRIWTSSRPSFPRSPAPGGPARASAGRPCPSSTSPAGTGSPGVKAGHRIGSGGSRPAAVRWPPGGRRIYADLRRADAEGKTPGSRWPKTRPRYRHRNKGASKTRGGGTRNRRGHGQIGGTEKQAA